MKKKEAEEMMNMATNKIKVNMENKRKRKQSRLKFKLLEGPEHLEKLKNIKIEGEKRDKVSELEAKMRVLTYDTAQLKKKILENRNICSKNKDLFSLLNSQQIQFTNILTSVRMASEGNLVTDRRYKVTFNNSREDKKFKEWMKKLKEKFNKTREFNFDLSHIWHEFSMKGKMVTMNTSRSAVSSDISETTENDDNTDLYKTRLDVSLYSKAIQGNLNNTMLKDYFKKDDKRFSSTESNYDKSGKTLMLLSPNTLSSKVRIKDTPRKIQNYFSGNSGVIEDIEEESEYPQKILKRPIYGVDYIEFDHFENQEKVVKSYKKKMEHKLIREIFNLMIEKGKIPRIFKGEKNMNIKLVLIKRYCYK